MGVLSYDGLKYFYQQYIKPLRTQIGTHKVEADVPANAKFTDTVYTHPTSAGNKHIPAGGASGQILRWSAAGTAVWGNDNNTTYTAFKGSTASAAGGTGLVPAPTAGAANRCLRADGTWGVVEVVKSIQRGTATLEGHAGSVQESGESLVYVDTANISIKEVDPDKCIVILNGAAISARSSSDRTISLPYEVLLLNNSLRVAASPMKHEGANKFTVANFSWQVIEFY